MKKRLQKRKKVENRVVPRKLLAELIEERGLFAPAPDSGRFNACGFHLANASGTVKCASAARGLEVESASSSLGSDFYSMMESR